MFDGSQYSKYFGALLRFFRFDAHSSQALAMKADVHVEEIGRQRFAAALPKLRAVVRGCSFVAIDTEMGGLSLQEYVVLSYCGFC